MNISAVSSSEAALTVAAARNVTPTRISNASLLASAPALPANISTAGTTESPAQIRSQISQLQQEAGSADGQNLAKIQQDIQQLQQAQKLAAQRAASQQNEAAEGTDSSPNPEASRLNAVA